MPEVDPRLVEAALAGSLPAERAADVLLAVLDAYSSADADRIIEEINARYGGPLQLARAPLERSKAPGRLEEDLVLRRAQEVLLQEAVNELGRDWLLDWRDAVDRFATAFDHDVAERRLASHRRAGFALAVEIDSEFRFPGFQFAEDGDLHRAALRANRTLLAHMHPWAAVSWWIYPDGRLLDRRPYELLNDSDPEPTLTRLAHASVGTAD